MSDSSSKIDPSELQLITQLIASARLEGLLEIEYKGLRMRFSPQAAQGGPVTIQKTTPRQAHAPLTWGSSLPSLKESTDEQV